MKIWHRYLLGRLIRSFLFFFLAILLFYVSLDFSIQGGRLLSKESSSWLDIGINYLRHFAKFAGLFLSLSFLLSMIRTLLEMNANREMIALQTAGLSTKKLLSPFLLFASLLAFALYANFQWIAPDAQQESDIFHQSHSRSPQKEEKVFSLSLQDGSELVYQAYDYEKKELKDVFWIRSFEEIWHIKTLKIAQRPFEGHFADFFMRKDELGLEKIESKEFKTFPEIYLEKEVSLNRMISLENRPLSTLFTQAIGEGSDKKRSAAHLHYKLAIPLLPILMIFSIAPFALRFSRSRSSLLFIAGSLFAFVGFMTLLDAMLILAENQALPTFLAIWGPIALSSLVGFYFFYKMR